MITVFYRKSCSSSRKAIQWFDEQGIVPEMRVVDHISPSEIKRLLQLTEYGTDEILKRPSRLTAELKNKKAALLELCFKEGIDFLVHHPETLRTPIILDDNKYLIGFNSDEIRKFIPPTSRKVQLHMSKNLEAGK